MSTLTGKRERDMPVQSAEIAFVDNAGSVVTYPRKSVPPMLLDPLTGQDRGSVFGQFQFDWQHHASLASLLFSTRRGDRMSFLDPVSGQPQLEPFSHDGWIVQRRAHPDGTVVATGSEDHTVRVWSVKMRRVQPLTLHIPGGVWEAQWSPKGDKIVSSSYSEAGGRMQLWDGQSGTPLVPPWKTDDIVYVVNWSPDGSRFASISEDNSAHLWSGQTGEAISPSLRHQAKGNHCAFSPDGSLLATAADDHTVRLWNGRTGEAIGAPLVHSHTPLKVAFSRDGHRLATASQDGTARIWAVPEGKLIVGPLAHDSTCWVAAFSPDDRLLLTASSDGTARLWDASTGKPVLVPLRHESAVFWASFSPDGRAIATSTESGIARVWSTATGQQLSQPMWHPDRVWFVKWSPDGQFLATTCMDGSARVWHAFTGHLVAEPFDHEPGKEVRRAEFSPDGRRLLTASLGGAIKIWDLCFLHPPLPVPDWLPELAEALGSKRIGGKDAPVSVPGNSLQTVKQRIQKVYASNDFYARWAKWMLEDRLEHPDQPFRP